jgi:hypothetical protein
MHTSALRKSILMGGLELGSVNPTERERGTKCVEFVGCFLENYRDILL